MEQGIKEREQRSLADVEKRLQHMQKQMLEWKIHGVVVHQQGQLKYSWFQSGADLITPVYSCTKSILSALIGIAIDKGIISPVEDPVCSYLPELSAQLNDSKRQITIADLLTMTSGLEWEEFDKPYWEMKKSADPVKFTFDKPLNHEPGAVFTYNSGGSHVLAVLLQQASGMNVSDFAIKYLFQPLGIEQFKWNDILGTPEGGTGLQLHLTDLAVFGDLYLNKGSYRGQQIVSEAWTQESTKVHHKALMHYKPNIFGAYGYHWWVSPARKESPLEYYFALGFGGQYLFVIPSLSIVAAVTKERAGRINYMLCKRLLFEYIVPLFGDNLTK